MALGHSRLWLLPLGLSLIGAGLLFNEVTIARWISVDGALETSTRVGVWIFDVGLVLLGLVIATRRTPSDPFLTVGLWAFSFILICGLFVMNDGLSQSQDFRVLHVTGQKVLSGDFNIYTLHGGSKPFYYAPIFTVLVVPLALIPFPWAAGLWALLNISALFATLIALSRWLFPGRQLIVAFLSLSLCIDIVLAHLENGQINLLLLAGVIFSLRWLNGTRVGRRWCGSVLFAMSVVTKVYLVALSLLVVRRGKMRRGLLVACAVGLVLLLPFAIFGIDRAAAHYHDWFAILRDTGNHVDLARNSNQSLYAMLVRSGGSAAWTGWTYGAVSAILLGIVVVLVNRRPSTAFDEDFAVDYGLTSCAVLLTCPLSWVQSYVLILPVVVVMTGGLFRSGPTRGLRVVGFGFTLLAALPARALVGERLRTELLNHSIYVWMLLGLFGVLVAQRARSS